MDNIFDHAFPRVTCLFVRVSFPRHYDVRDSTLPKLGEAFVTIIIGTVGQVGIEVVVLLYRSFELFDGLCDTVEPLVVHVYN